jgi:hypothetical protein
MNRFYEENYNAGRIKGTAQYVEDFANMNKKKLQKYMTPSEKITLNQVYNIFGDLTINESKRKKDTLDKFKGYLKQTYPNS